MNLFNCKIATPNMKDNKKDMITPQQLSNDHGIPLNEKDSVNLRLALAIEQLTSDDFFFDDEMDE